jgi:phospholipid-binding lipoprotein MlaA
MLRYGWQSTIAILNREIFMKLRLSALALSATVLVGCASTGEQTGRSDPLEGFNRTMYSFNYNVLDPYVIRPVAVAWRDYVPSLHVTG